jgi:DNA topoisomerase-2
MQEKDQAIIESKAQKVNFTCITFYPDLSKFNMKVMDADIISLMTKRAYDLAGVTEGRVAVKLNGKTIRVKNFNQYCDLYLKNKASLAEDLPKIVEKTQERWEIIASLSDGQF